MVSKIVNITVVPDIQKVGTVLRLEESSIDRIIGSHLETLSESRRFPEGAELREFFELVQMAVTSRQNSEGVPEDKRILFLGEDPPEALDTEAVTYFVRSRLPGKFDQGPAGQGRIKEATPHVRAIREHPDHPSEKLITMGRFYDNWITFTVYAKTDKVALARVLWFERLMDTYNWLYRLHGFRVIEEEVGSREKIKLDESTITVYPMQYMVRTDDTFHYGTQELREILLNVNVSTSGNE
jgi:hypothetical protein